MWIAFPFIRQDIVARQELDWDVTHFPKAPNGQRYTRETSDGVGLPSNTKDAGQAWVFVTYICSLEGQKEFARLGRAVPSRRSVANSPEYLRPDTPQHEEDIVKALAYSRPQPITPNFRLAERAMARYEVPLYDDTNMMPPQKLLQQLQDVLRQLDISGQLLPDWEPKP
jgi:ABC-type glycerol-3-phosphate transport system substrate-binding protein